MWASRSLEAPTAENRGLGVAKDPNAVLAQQGDVLAEFGEQAERGKFVKKRAVPILIQDLGRVNDGINSLTQKVCKGVKRCVSFGKSKSIES